MTRRPGIFKRNAAVPQAFRTMLNEASKADLLEAAWDLAAIAHEHGCDDDAATAAKRRATINECRARRGGRPLKGSST